jgi:hypothetical protein
MVIEGCLLHCASKALQKVNNNDELLSSIIIELTVAEALANAHDLTFNNSHFMTASANTKRRVKQTLNEISWKVYDHLLEAMKLFNLYCDKQDKLGNKPTQDLFDFKYQIDSVLRAFDNCYLYYEINQKQLSLF